MGDDTLRRRTVGRWWARPPIGRPSRAPVEVGGSGRRARNIVIRRLARLSDTAPGVSPHAGTSTLTPRNLPHTRMGEQESPLVG